MIQFHKFTGGGFVLHKVVVNGHTYSVWYGTDGLAYSAERRKGDRVYNVPARQVNVFAEFNKIGKRYLTS